MTNPIGSLVPDPLFQQLISLNLLNMNTLRDFQIKNRYHVLREQNVRAWDALETIQEEYPYLQLDTLRKIVYRKAS